MEPGTIGSSVSLMPSGSLVLQPPVVQSEKWEQDVSFAKLARCVCAAEAAFRDWAVVCERIAEFEEQLLEREAKAQRLKRWLNLERQRIESCQVEQERLSQEQPAPLYRESMSEWVAIRTTPVDRMTSQDIINLPWRGVDRVPLRNQRMDHEYAPITALQEYQSERIESIELSKQLLGQEIRYHKNKIAKYKKSLGELKLLEVRRSLVSSLDERINLSARIKIIHKQLVANLWDYSNVVSDPDAQRNSSTVVKHTIALACDLLLKQQINSKWPKLSKEDASLLRSRFHWITAKDA